MGAMIGVLVLMIANLVLGLFGVNMGLRDGSWLAIVFSLVVIGVAAFSLLLDFEQATQAINAQVPAKFAWYIAFGLMTTLVWLYSRSSLLSYVVGLTAHATRPAPDRVPAVAVSSALKQVRTFSRRPSRPLVALCPPVLRCEAGGSLPAPAGSTDKRTNLA